MAPYQLYCFAQSGNAYKVALALQLAGADWSPRFVDFFNGETRTPAYRAINLMGEVPVLEHGGLRLSQSGVILDYLAAQFPQFGPSNEEERRYVVADRLTTADLSLCGYLFWPAEYGVDWVDYPAIGAWLQRLQSLPGWVAPYDVMPGHPRPQDLPA